MSIAMATSCSFSQKGCPPSLLHLPPPTPNAITTPRQRKGGGGFLAGIKSRKEEVQEEQVEEMEEDRADEDDGSGPDAGVTISTCCRDRGVGGGARLTAGSLASC